MQLATYAPLLPDAWLIFVVLLAESLATFGVRRAAYPVALFGSLIAAILFAGNALDPHTYLFFHNAYVVDSLASVIKAVVCVGFAVTLIYSRGYLDSRQLNRDEFFLLALFSLVGQLLMISGSHFLTLYLGLEMNSLSLYALIAMRRDDKVSTEAAMKYFVLGALASGFLLYGISMTYGATGSLELAGVYRAIASGRINETVLVFGLIFIVAGVAFKLGVVPFHMWVPDVYEGAPTPMTLLVGTGPKVAAFVFAFRFLVDGMLPLAGDWQQMLVIISALSLILGNLMGIVQKSFKRMLAYSAISHQGFVLLGLLAGVFDGNANGASLAYSSAMFYSIVYLLTTLAAFGVILLLSRPGFEADSLDDLKGLNQRSPWTAFMLLLVMFSLTGIPPTVGFYAKLAVLDAVINAHMTWLAVLAVISSIFGAFYYLRVIKLAYFDAPVDGAPLVASRSAHTVLALNGLAVLALGILPGPLMTLCQQTMRHLLGG